MPPFVALGRSRNAYRYTVRVRLWRSLSSTPIPGRKAPFNIDSLKAFRLYLIIVIVGTILPRCRINHEIPQRRCSDSTVLGCRTKAARGRPRILNINHPTAKTCIDGLLRCFDAPGREYVPILYKLCCITQSGKICPHDLCDLYGFNS